MCDIQKLRRQQEAEQVAPESPALMNELRALRQRKGELEGHLGALQDSRRQLMAQLEGLMRMLKNHQTQSPRSTPNSSPRSGKSPPLPQGPQMQSQSRGPMSQNVPPHLQQSLLQQQQQQLLLNSHHQEHPGGMGHPHPLDMRGYAPNGNNNFDEMQMASHEWSEKDNAQWQEQFAQWSLNSQNQ